MPKSFFNFLSGGQSCESNGGPDEILRKKAGFVMRLFCCNKEVNCGEVWFLKDIKGFTERKMFIGLCPVCRNKAVILSEKRIEDNKTFINEFVGINAVKTIFREEKRKEQVIPDISSDSLYGWVFGVNVQIKNKKGTVIRQYASDFKGNRQLRKETIS